MLRVSFRILEIISEWRWPRHCSYLSSQNKTKAKRGGNMKNLFITLVAASSLVACSSPKAAKPNAANNGGNPGFTKPDPVTSIANAVEAFKSKGYKPNTKENQDFANEIVGADMLLEQTPNDKTSKLAKVSVVLSNCDTVSKY
jgi:hypothetical protein